MNKIAKDYISFLAGQTGTDISAWKLADVFGKETDKKNLNKLFFEARQLAMKLAEPGENKLASIKKDIRVRTKPNNRIINSLESKIKKNVNSISLLHKKLEKLMSECVEKKIELSKAKKQESVDLRPQIENILSEGWWTNPIMDGKNLWLHTNGNIFVKYLDDHCNCEDESCSDETDIEINFGKLAAYINLENLDIRVFPYENNLDSYGYHMYVNSDDGTICWGNSVGIVAKLKNELNLYKLMKLLAALLSSCVDDNGFTSITDFIDAGKLNIKSFYAENGEECGECDSCNDGDECENLDIVHPEFRKAKK